MPVCIGLSQENEMGVMLFDESQTIEFLQPRTIFIEIRFWIA